MSEQPVILPTSTRGKPGRNSPVRNLFLLVISLVIIIVVLNLVVGAFNKPERSATPVTTPSATSEPYITPSPSPTPTETTAPVLYDDCAAVWVALQRPIFKEDDGYREIFDWDANGVGCEDNPSTPEDESTVDWTSVRERFRENLDDLGDFVIPKAEDFWDQAKDFLSR